jgi:hypothetical protein
VLRRIKGFNCRRGKTDGRGKLRVLIFRRRGEVEMGLNRQNRYIESIEYE